MSFTMYVTDTENAMQSTASKTNANQYPGDNVYYKQAATPPQAYVPYAPVQPLRTFTPPEQRYAPTDNTMMVLAIVGLVVTVMVGLPVGIFTGPAALKRASALEHQVNIGRRPISDRSMISSARVTGWISLVWSAVIVVIWLAAIGLLMGMSRM